MPMALSLICCDMQLYVCAENLFDADRQTRAGAHSLAAPFVYVFRGVSLRAGRGRKDTGQTAASAECGARKLNFDMRAAFSRGGCVTYVFFASASVQS